jgi:hypothetical protein
MKRYLFYSLIVICLTAVLLASALVGIERARAQSLVVGEMSASVGHPMILRAKSLDVNQTGADIGSFTNLPPRYIVRRLTFDNASATPTLSTVSLRTATGGGGTAIVSAQALSTLSATTTFVDSTLAVTTTAQTASTLTLRAVAAAGGAATVDATLEITPLP